MQLEMHSQKEVVHAKGVHSQRDCSPWVTHAKAGTDAKGLWSVDNPQWSRHSKTEKWQTETITTTSCATPFPTEGVGTD